MKDEKRVLKGYKIKDSVYKKAMKRVKKDKFPPLATVIEAFVTAYGNGEEIRIIKYESNGSGLGTTLDLHSYTLL